YSLLDCDPAAREARLAELCRGDAALQQDVAQMLADAFGNGASAGASLFRAPLVTRGDTAWPPATIGHYRILRLIGEGGMGSVSEAEQIHPRRTVALKAIKPGFANAHTLRRFELEGQALGRLQHAGIAQIYEAGTVDTPFGVQPYFAMELVRGPSLYE